MEKAILKAALTGNTPSDTEAHEILTTKFTCGGCGMEFPTNEEAGQKDEKPVCSQCLYS